MCAEWSDTIYVWRGSSELCAEPEVRLRCEDDGGGGKNMSKLSISIRGRYERQQYCRRGVHDSTSATSATRSEVSEEHKEEARRGPRQEKRTRMGSDNGSKDREAEAGLVMPLLTFTGVVRYDVYA